MVNYLLYFVWILHICYSKSQPIPDYPFPFPDNISPCDMTQSPPAILSFHVHVVFNGQNQTTTTAAFDLRSQFIQETNANMVTCPFPHPYAAGAYEDICAFEMHGSKFPYPIDGIFSQTNYAFFIPPQHYLYTSMWFRQYHNPQLLSYMLHVNTGCETNDHGIWSMVNENYPYFTNTTALLCCHDGPINCYCSITQYFEKSNNQSCITANYQKQSLEIASCKGDWTTGWRETHYNSTFIQIENVGTGPTGGNTYMCLGQSDSNICMKGTSLGLIKCYQNDKRLVLFNYDKQSQKIKTMNCGNELCVSVNNNGVFVLDDCIDAMFFGSTDSW